MAFIEGVGDEVVQFFILVLLTLLAILAWWSTRISDRPFVRTVLIVERADRRRSNPVPATSNDPVATDSNSPITEECKEEERGEQEEAVSEDRTIQQQTKISANTNGTGPQSLADICKELLEKSQRNADNNTDGDGAGSGNNESDAQSSSAHPSSDSTQFIRIRLKYLNDDLKLVEGDLQEPLGEFKRRHFMSELSGRKLVRLIFNGHVLGQDNNTLGHYGLFDNCVVHCVVHNARTPPPSPNLSDRRRNANENRDSVANRITAIFSNTAVLNLILLFTFSTLFAFAWYCRFHYSQLFTANTTVALLGLTCIFIITTLGLYMSEVS